jgi:hypothetical protein
VLGIISVILGVVIWVLIVGAGQGTCTINGSPC